MPRSAGKAIAAGVACRLLLAATAWAQSPSRETTTPPSIPPPTMPPDVPALPEPTAREAQLEQRILQLESIIYQMQRGQPAAPGVGGGIQPGGTGLGVEGSGLSPSEPGVTPTPGAVETGSLPRASVSRSGGIGVPGQSLPPVPPPNNRFNAPATLEDKRARVRFGPGFELVTDDDEFILQFHDLTQVDYRGYLQGGQATVHDTFGIPRQWWMFSGHATKEVGYFVSFAQGFAALNGLDMFVDFNYDRRLQFRVGRFKTPFTYEFFVMPIQGLITPERSPFFNNYAQNRDVGVMAYGQLFNGPDFGRVGKLQYAAGLFNAARNGYLALQDAKALSALVNVHPFGDRTDSLLENFDVGGSVYTSVMAQASTPNPLRTVVPASGNSILGVPFLTLNNAFREQGPMAFWDLHAAWYYRQLAVIGEWQSGYQDYARFATPAEATRHIRVPVESYYIMGSYLLTGETRSSIGVVKPNRPFSLRAGEFGPGAWELFSRYDYMDIGSSVYDYGLAGRVGNANRLWMIDVGLNWYMTQYVKMYFDWSHTEFNNPVSYNAHRYQPTSNILWWRLQLYF